MSTAAKRRKGRPAIEMLENAVKLLRTAPVGAVLAYYVGSVPCMLGLLYFWADMCRGAFARQHVAEASLTAAGLYLWMKCWHTVSNSRLYAHLMNEPEAPWTVSRVIRVVMIQAAIQPLGLPLRFIAAQIVLPYVWTYGFFQNVGILGNGTRESWREILEESARQAKLWLWPAHRALGGLFLFTVFVWLNLFILFLIIPVALKMFFGEETVFSRNIFAMINTTTFASTIVATYLCIDPIRKALYVLRCFHGASLRSGEDLRVELRSLRASARSAAVASVAALWLFASPANTLGAEPPAPSAVPPATHVESKELSGAMDRVLERREYSWRLPRDPAPAAEKGGLAGFLADVKKWVGDTMTKAREMWRKVTRRLDRLFKSKTQRDQDDQPGLAGSIAAQWTLLALVAALLIIAGVLLWRWKKGRPTEVAVPESAAVPDLREESVTADQLPEDGWLELSRSLAERGELRLALRALYLSALAHLSHRQLIGIARHKSNRDYDRELRRRARENTDLLRAFEASLQTFEATWYGEHPVTAETLGGFTAHLERIRAC